MSAERVPWGMSYWREEETPSVGRFLTVAFVMAAVGALGLLAIALWSSVLVGVVEGTVWPAPLGAARQQVVGTVALGAGTTMTVAGYLAWSSRSLSFLDVSTPSPRDLAVAVGGLVGLFGALYAISTAFRALGVPTSQHSLAEAGAANPELYLALVPLSILVVGPGEELLYRNVVQKALYDVAPRSVAVVTASVIFATVHVPAYSTGGGPTALLATLLIVFVLSLGLGAIYAHTETVVVPALVHGSYNAVTFALAYLEATDTALLGDAAAALL